MSAKDRTEEVLKSIHVLFSKAQPIEDSKKKVIIDRDLMMQYLKELNDCMYEMMDEYEITVQSKERARREFQKESDEMVIEYRKHAEDIYAASIMYSDHALSEVQGILDKLKASMDNAHTEMNKKIDKSKQVLKDNQLDLKNQLSSLIDTQKYLMLIENENKRLKHEATKEEQSDGYDKKLAIKGNAEIRVNEDYFLAKAKFEGKDLPNTDERKDS